MSCSYAKLNRNDDRRLAISHHSYCRRFAGLFMRIIMPRTLIAALSLLASFNLGAADPQVELKTNMGAITLELYPDKAPETVKNFLQYVQDGFYAGTVFHRVIDGFMIQGGGFRENLTHKPGREPIKNEASNGVKNEAGTVAMARTGDPHSATTQFFINVNNNEFLNYPGRDGYGYAVFGKVIKGMDVVDRIAKVGTTPRPPHQNVPVRPVIIESAHLVGAPAKKPAKIKKVKTGSRGMHQDVPLEDVVIEKAEVV